MFVSVDETNRYKRKLKVYLKRDENLKTEPEIKYADEIVFTSHFPMIRQNISEARVTRPELELPGHTFSLILKK